MCPCWWSRVSLRSGASAAVVEEAEAVLEAEEEEVVAEHVPVLEEEVVVAVQRRGPISTKAARADHPLRHDPAFPIRLPRHDPANRRPRVRVVARLGIPISIRRSPINRVAAVVPILEWVIDPA